MRDMSPSRQARIPASSRFIKVDHEGVAMCVFRDKVADVQHLQSVGHRAVVEEEVLALLAGATDGTRRREGGRITKGL